MTPTVIIEPEAEEELLAAISWYEDHRPGLGREFFRTIDRAIDQLKSSLDQSLPVPGVSGDLDVRRVIIGKFPFAVVFMPFEREIRILAIAHLRKRPGYWQSRI